jgi:transposase
MGILMTRRVLSDEMWEQLNVILKLKGCHEWSNDREIMEAILWKLRTGAPWRDLPKEFCPWQTAYNRFNRWSKKGLWQDFF